MSANWWIFMVSSFVLYVVLYWQGIRYLVKVKRAKTGTLANRWNAYWHKSNCQTHLFISSKIGNFTTGAACISCIIFYFGDKEFQEICCQFVDTDGDLTKVFVID